MPLPAWPRLSNGRTTVSLHSLCARARPRRQTHSTVMSLLAHATSRSLFGQYIYLVMSCSNPSSNFQAGSHQRFTSHSHNLTTRDGSREQAQGPFSTLLSLPARDVQARGRDWHPFVYCLSILCVCEPDTLDIVPSFSVHPDELQESTKKKLNDRGYFYANSNAGLGWTDRANRYALAAIRGATVARSDIVHREAFYRWRIIPRTCVDTNTRDLTSMWNEHLVMVAIVLSQVG